MAIDFSGGNKYISTSSLPVTDVPFTIACWFKAPNVTAEHPLVNIVDISRSDIQYGLMASGNIAGDPIRAFSFDSVSFFAAAVTSTGFSANTWHHAAGVWESPDSNRTAYLDGGSAGSNTSSRSVSAAALDRFAIGALIDATPTYGSAIIAEVGVWNIALTSADILSLSKGVSPLMVRPDALVSYLPLLDQASPSIDIITGQDLTWTASPTKAAHSKIIYPSAQILQFPPTAAGGGFSPYWAAGSNVIMNNGSP